MHVTQEVVGLGTVRREGDHVFEFGRGLLETTKYGVEEGLFVQGLGGIIAGSSVAFPVPDVLLERGEFLLLQLLVEVLAIFDVLALLHQAKQ